jgi:hypothetical protein
VQTISGSSLRVVRVTLLRHPSQLAADSLPGVTAWAELGSRAAAPAARKPVRTCMQRRQDSSSHWPAQTPLLLDPADDRAALAGSWPPACWEIGIGPCCKLLLNLSHLPRPLLLRGETRQRRGPQQRTCRRDQWQPCWNPAPNPHLRTAPHPFSAPCWADGGHSRPTGTNASIEEVSGWVPYPFPEQQPPAIPTDLVETFCATAIAAVICWCCWETAD